MLTETLEQRLLLAGDLDVDLTDVDRMGGRPLFAQVSAEGEAPLGAAVETIEAAEQIGSDAIDSFATGLREAVDEISRVVAAINSAPALAAEIPYLGSLVPESIAGSTLIDTATVQSLFSLADRFETDVAQPLTTFLDSNPTATAIQLISHFDFLDPVAGLTSGQHGVKLNFDLEQQFNSTITSMLEPITTQVGSLLQGLNADELATQLPFDVSLDDVSFEVIRDAADGVSVAIPDFRFSLVDQEIPINFATNVGFLAGGISGGSIDADFGFVVETGDLFGGRLSLEDLRELSLFEELASLRLQPTGRGLDIRLPFDFQLDGLDMGGFLPVLTAHDDNPFDGRFPEFELQVPRGADYDAGAITGFASINATSVLSTLDELGTMFLGWEQGELLNYPLPLGDDVSVGDVAGFADAYSGAVMQFLRTEEGLPAFHSIQELADLIPRSGQVGDFVTFDQDAQTLTLDLGFVWNPDDIVRRADIDILAGAEDSPIASIQMNSGANGTDNRLVISRDIAFDFEVQIGLKERLGAKSNLLGSQIVVPTENAVAAPGRTDAVVDNQNARISTPMLNVLNRLGLSHLASTSQTLSVTLNDGMPAVAAMGKIDETVTIGEWLERGTVRAANGSLRMTLRYEPTVVVGAPYDDFASRFIVVDHTSGQDRVDIKINYSDATGVGVNDTTPLNDSDVPWATTIGEARRFAIDAAADHLESLLAISGNYRSFAIDVKFRAYAGSTLASANPTEWVVGDRGFGGDPNFTYPIALANHLNGGPVTVGGNVWNGPVVDAEFDVNEAWDYEVSTRSDRGKQSLFKIATHEILHGLGLSDRYLENGSQLEAKPSVYTSFFALATTSPGTGTTAYSPIISQSFPQGVPNATLAAAFISDRLFFTGPNARAANPKSPGDRVKLFAPTDYAGGSSLSHIDTLIYAASGETMIHEFSASDELPIGVTKLSKALLNDLGFTGAAIATTTVDTTLPFWDRMFESGTASFGVPTSVSFASNVGLSDLSASLSTFYLKETKGLDQPSQPMLLTLADGTEKQIQLGSINSLKLTDILDALSVKDEGEIKSTASFEEDAIVVRDKTDAIAGKTFSLQAVNGASGSTLVQKFLQPGRAAADQSVMVIPGVIETLATTDLAVLSLTTLLTEFLSESEENTVLKGINTVRIHRAGAPVQDVSVSLNARSTLADRNVYFTRQCSRLYD